MPKYFYKATDNNGDIREGAIDAANVDELEMRLDQMGLMLISLKGNFSGLSLLTRRRSIGRRNLIVFCFNMEQMALSGVPLIEGMVSLRTGVEDVAFKELITALVEDIRSGRLLSQAMESHPETFSPIFIRLIHVGEQTGNLGEIFRDLSENLKWEDELVSQAKKIVTYPAIVGTAVVGLVFFLMIYLVPQLMQFILEMGGDLPLHTRALIAVSDFISSWWHLLLPIPLLVFIFIKFAVKISVTMQRRIDQFKLNLWMFGPLIRKIILVRFARSFALMYKSGIPVLDSLSISEGLSDNLVIREALERARRMVSEGKGITESFQAVGFFPPLVLNMLQVGESFGKLDQSLLNISYFYDRDVKENIARLQTAIEPLLTVVLGGVIGWVIMSVLGPIYQLIEKL
ncbi:MAG: type II secretion system F family protein [Magnetococcales bacterium]|nr:type II secretion system F family protein [Magnetococcales bacterium]